MQAHALAKKPNISVLARVKSIHSVSTARAFLGLSQSQLGSLIGVHQSVICKAERGKIRLSDLQMERLAVEVARLFRRLTGRDDWGLKYHYNSPLTFEAWGVCYNHVRPVEYRLERMTTRCPKCAPRR